MWLTTEKACHTAKTTNHDSFKISPTANSDGALINKLVTVFAEPLRAYRDKDVFWFQSYFLAGLDW
jgi:hypothetical protein